MFSKEVTDEASVTNRGVSGGVGDLGGLGDLGEACFEIFFLHQSLEVDF